MCGPRGEIADVFVRWCIEYRNGGDLIQASSKIAKKVDKRFNIGAIKVDMEKLGSKDYRKKVARTAKGIKKGFQGSVYVGVYSFFPVHGMKLHEEGDILEFTRFLFAGLGPSIGDGKCICESFASEKGKEAVILIAFCDEELYQSISKNKSWLLDYWYKNTDGVEKEDFRQRIEKRNEVFRKFREETETKRR